MNTQIKRSIWLTAILLTALVSSMAAPIQVIAMRGEQMVDRSSIQADPLVLSDLDLLQSTDLSTWSDVPGSFTDGFHMVLDPAVGYYYLDTANLVVNNPLADGYHEFFVDSYPADYFDYWASRGVVDGASGWQGIMWEIINGRDPIFYLKVAGTDYDLIDGLQKLAGGGDNPLRIEGSYLPGAYTFTGLVTDTGALTDEVTVGITFWESPVDPLMLSDVDLLQSTDTVTWTDVPGNLPGGFSMVLDTSVDYYYFDAANLVVNRPLAQGHHYFKISSWPDGFFDYWASRGVTAESTGDAAVMWQIITAQVPFFCLNVEGDSLMLIDAFQRLTGRGDHPLRVNGTYLPGDYSFSGQITDVLGYVDWVTVDITFNDLPVAHDQTVSTNEDTPLNITLEVDDLFPGPLSWFYSDPIYGTLSGTAPDLVYTPDSDVYGSDSFTFYVNDGFEDSNIATVNITVSSVNDAPVLNPIGNQTAMENELFTLTATASDVDLPPDTLTFSLDDLDGKGATLDPVTGVFEWTPDEADGPGTFSFTINVCDDGEPSLCANETFDIYVNYINNPPVVDPIDDMTTEELVELTFTATASDPDIPAFLEFELGSVVGGQFPSGATIAPDTGVFSWTPTEAQGPGVYDFRVWVCDNGVPGLCDYEPVKITVTEVNVAPALDSIGSKSATPEVLLTFLATASDDDLPANTLTFSLEGAPSGASITTGGTFTWTPAKAQANDSYDFTVKVCDNGSPVLCDSELITVTVAPLSSEKAILSFTITGGTTVLNEAAKTITVTMPHGTDPTALVPSISVSPFATVAPPSGVSQDFSSPVIYTVTAQNGTTQPYTVTVVIANNAPTDIHLNPSNIEENKAIDTVVGALTTDDPDSDETFTYQLVSGLGSADNASFGISGSNLIAKAVFDFETKDSYSIRIQSTDRYGLTVEKAFTVTVLDVNDAPALDSIGSKSATPEVLLTFLATASDDDLPANTLTFSLEGAPSGASITTGGTFTWTPAKAQANDSYDFTVKVCDNGSPVLCDSELITVTVAPLSSEKAILSFTIPGGTTVLNEAAKTITVTMPPGTDPTALVPSITVSPFATIAPPSGVSQDFSSPVIYTVTAQDGTPQPYTVSVIVSPYTLFLPIIFK